MKHTRRKRLKPAALAAHYKTKESLERCQNDRDNMRAEIKKLKSLLKAARAIIDAASMEHDCGEVRKGRRMMVVRIDQSLKA